jgi:leader peptidase (prepilin peptidase)/N-methyltransferase
MGSGDFWVFILISFLLTPQTILKSLHVSIISGGVYSLILVFIDRKNLKKQIPFIPFMTIGFLMAIFFDIL